MSRVISYLRSASLLFVVMHVGIAQAESAAPSNPFNGENLDGWTTKEPKDRSHWQVGKVALDATDLAKIVIQPEGQELVNVLGRGVDIYTLARYGDVQIELEVMVPKGSNSGIYVMGEYEVQIYDSFGKKELAGIDMGAIYGAAPPKTNAQKAPGEWNKYVIRFRAPRFNDDGQRIKKARFESIVLNGQTIHADLEMNGPTPSGVTGKEHATGPIMFQGDHGPVAFRNIKLTPLED